MPRISHQPSSFRPSAQPYSKSTSPPPPSTPRRRFFSGSFLFRSRLHPILFVPVFILGNIWGPYLHHGRSGASDTDFWKGVRAGEESNFLLAVEAEVARERIIANGRLTGWDGLYRGGASENSEGATGSAVSEDSGFMRSPQVPERRPTHPTSVPLANENFASSSTIHTLDLSSSSDRGEGPEWTKEVNGLVYFPSGPFNPPLIRSIPLPPDQKVKRIPPELVGAADDSLPVSSGVDEAGAEAIPNLGFNGLEGGPNFVVAPGERKPKTKAKAKAKPKAKGVFNAGPNLKGDVNIGNQKGGGDNVKNTVKGKTGGRIVGPRPPPGQAQAVKGDNVKVGRVDQDFKVRMRGGRGMEGGGSEKREKERVMQVGDGEGEIDGVKERGVDKGADGRLFDRRDLDSNVEAGAVGDTRSPPPSESEAPPLELRALKPWSASGPLKADQIRHPIFDLMDRAEKKWESMVRRQSTSLEEAVRVYEKRYRRRPPKGFDRWWAFAMQNRLGLVDEFDRIHDDLEPFFSLPPTDFRRRVMQLTTTSDLLGKGYFTVMVRDGVLDMVAGPGREGARAWDVADMIERIVGGLPDMDITFSSEMTPMVRVAGDIMEEHLSSAKEGKYVDEAIMLDLHDVPHLNAIHNLCPPSSPARNPTAWTSQLIMGPSFVSLDHSEAKDVCKHPHVAGLHGYTIGRQYQKPPPTRLYPVFGPSKSSINGDITAPSLEGFFREVEDDVPWEGKESNRLLWRGDTSGLSARKGVDWTSSHRHRLALMGNDSSSFTTVRWADDSEGGALKHFRAWTAEANAHFLDVAFSGDATDCEDADGTCEAMRRRLPFSPRLSWDEIKQYKYVLDMDSETSSTTFLSMLSSSAVVLKSTIFHDWNSERLIPWYHYVPVKVDLSDLYDVLGFFVGRVDGTGGHDALAKKIADNGKIFAESHWRTTDMEAYIFRLLLEYSRLLNRTDRDPHSMDFVLD